MRGIATSLFLMGGIVAAAADEPVAPRFADETATAGIVSTFTGEWEFMVGGGAAVFDCDGDRMPDLLVAGGTSKASFFRNRGEPAGALAFEAMESGLELDMVSGAYPLDVDSDGLMDVVLLRVGENVVMRGRGGCRFERANEAFGFAGGDEWSTSFSATFERGRNWPTMAIGNYIDREEEAFPWGNCSDNALFRPADGDSGFAPPLALTPSHCTLSMLFTDWNRSGTQSLRVSNDREYYKGGQEQLWRVEPGQAPTAFTAAEGWKVLKIWGMGIADRDLDGDGYPEYFLTSMADNKLQKLAATGENLAPTYGDVAFAKGVTAHRPYTGGEIRPSTAWHAEFEDVNNDGLADLFVAKGNVWEMPDFAQKDPNNLLVQKADGGFVEMGDRAGVASMLTARGGALTDLNLDGLVDLVVVNRHGPTEVWRNVTGNAGNWLQVEPVQPDANRQAIGGWIEVRCGEAVMRREIVSGGGHAGGQAGWWHFGIGEEAEAELRILWPDGTEGPWERVAANGFYLVEKGKAAAAWTAR